MPARFERFVRALDEHGVRYVLIGGAALELHGSGYRTEDVDLVYARDSANIERLVRALALFRPRLRVRGEPAGLPILFDARFISNGENFTFVTDIGDVDIFGRIAGNFTFETLQPLAARFDMDGVTVSMLTLHGLRTTKMAAGRPKDALALPEIEAMLEAERVRNEEHHDA